MSSPAVEAESPGPWPVAWWRSLPGARRAELVLLALITAAAVAHQAVLANWYIEDAAISFAYARHLADGEGLVPFPGGERVEGYSNPSWVFLLALFELVGVSAFAAARGLQFVLAAATVPLVYALGREAAPRRPARVGLLAAAVLAGSAQFAIWGASGLENALFNFLLAASLWRLAVEARQGGVPWSALGFFLVAVTRPEAVLYAAVGGCVALLAHLQARRGFGPVAAWAAMFLVPFVAYHAWRWTYFAWPLPNTYYAKIGDHKDPEPLRWAGKGWRYVRDWAGTVGVGPLLPVVFLGLTGSRGGRPLAAVGAALLVALTVLLPGDQRLLLPAVLLSSFAFFWAAARRQARPPAKASAGALVLIGLVVAAAEFARARWGATSTLPAPEWLDGSAPYALLAVFLLLPLTVLGRPGQVPRLACWGTVGVAVFFAVYSNGDWMRGFRWMSLLAVPGSVLFACGLAAAGDLAQAILGRREGVWRVAGWAAVAAGLAGLVVPNLAHTLWYARNPDTTPWSVRQRVRYMDAVRDRLHIDERVVALDVDQGAHLWWSDFEMLDLAGLIDVSMAQGRHHRDFVREYLFEEERPHFAHVHGSWASSSRIPTHPEWRRDYVEIPGYPAGKKLHVGNHVRRDLVLVEAWDGEDPERSRNFEGDVELVGWRVPSPEVAAGRRVYLEAGFRSHVRRNTREAFRIVAFLSRGDRLVTWELAPGYDWLPPHTWRTTDLFVGRWSLRLPDDLPTGRYDLGFAVLGPVGPLAARIAEEGPPRFAHGEVVFAGVVDVQPLEAVRAAAEADFHASIDQATTGACDAAERSWWLARMHLPRDEDWVAPRRDAARRALAECHAARSETDPSAAVAHLARARAWDHRAPRVRAAARPVAEALYARGLEARAAGDWEAAYAAFSDTLRVDPSRSWARRYAEEARAYRLGYDPETVAREKAEQQRRREEARARAEARIREAAERDREVDAKAAALIEARRRGTPTLTPQADALAAPAEEEARDGGAAP